MNKIDAIVDIIDNWETNDLVTAWNERCEEQDLYDERIEDMYSFDELYDGMKPTEIADMLHIMQNLPLATIILSSIVTVISVHLVM